MNSARQLTTKTLKKLWQTGETFKSYSLRQYIHRKVEENTREIEESTTESDILARNEKLVEFLAVCERQAVIQNMSFYNQSVVENAKDRGFFETESKTAPK